MIPSRGLRWSTQHIGLGRRRLEPALARSFSSTFTSSNGSSSPTSLASRAGAWHRRTPLRPQIPGATHAMRNVASVRFKSTSPAISGTNETVTASLDNSPWAQSSTDLSSLNEVIDLTSSTFDKIPEQIGYLKAMGLQYGFGPTGMMEWILEHVHVLAGTPWWASIAITGLIVRIICFYPNVVATDNAAKMASIAHLTKPLMEKSRDAARRSDSAEAMKLRAELQALNRKTGVNYWKSFVPLIQVPIGFGTFILLRAMTKLPVPGLENGGLLWFYNLTISDPLFIVPLCTAGVLHWVLRKGGETGVQTMSAGFLRGLSYLLPIISLVFTIFLPAAIQVSFLVTGVFSFLQAQLFRSPLFRDYMKMTPLPKNNPNTFDGASKTESASSPYQPRIVLATPRPSPGANSATYEAPRSPNGSSSGIAGAKASLLSRVRREVTTGISSVKEAAAKSVESARQMAGEGIPKDGKRTKRQLQVANDYEMRRRREESKRREDIRRLRRARRDAKNNSD